MLHAVIIAGGHGERFWPRSRFHKPKQLQAITGTETMLQLTVKRVQPLIPLERVHIVTSRELEEEVGRQLPKLPAENIIPEPFGRNTAAAIGLSAVSIERVDKSAVMAVLPADHLILDDEKFLFCVSAAGKIAEERQCLVVFGIKPDRPETGYGYIHAGERISNGTEEDTAEIYEVEAFVEKPDESKAKEFLVSGKYYWNSGMFVWTYHAIMSAVKKHMPKLFNGLEQIREASSADEKETIAKVYSRLEDISIDYGVIEKEKNRIMVGGNFRWDDVGSWLAVERVWQKDEHGNVTQGEFIEIDTHNSIIVSDKALIGTIGVSDMIIVAQGDAILICPKGKAQEVKKLVRKLAGSKLKKYVQ